MSATDPSAADGSVVAPPAGASSSPARTSRTVPDRTRSRAFPREARLLNGRAYDAVFGDNRRIADRFWTVLAHRVPIESAPPSAVRPAARLGLAVAKKRARRAVDRNRIKRVARESFRHARDALAGYDVVVMNRDAATAASATELRGALDTLWARLLRQSSGQGGDRSGGRRSRSSAQRPSARPPSVAARPGQTGRTPSDDERTRDVGQDAEPGNGSR